MATPYGRLKTSDLNTLNSTQLGSLKPYQLCQVIEVLDKLKWDRGSQSDVSVQPTIADIVTALGSNNP